MNDNPLRLPWKVGYVKHSGSIDNIGYIEDCNGNWVLELESDYCIVNRNQAEAIVAAVNEKYASDWKKKVGDPVPVPFELPLGPCTPPTEVFHVPQGPCDPMPEPWVQPIKVT